MNELNPTPQSQPPRHHWTTAPSFWVNVLIASFTVLIALFVVCDHWKAIRSWLEKNDSITPPPSANNNTTNGTRANDTSHGTSADYIGNGIEARAQAAPLPTNSTIINVGSGNVGSAVVNINYGHSTN
jgi:hypothetical protein